MDGEKFHITLTEGAKPFCIKTPRTVLFAYRDKLKAELQILETQAIITPVTYPTEWCTPFVVTPNKDSDNIRMCVDLSHLNKCDGIWENPPYGIHARFAQCAFLVS